MRTKLLIAIACLLGVCIGFGACVKGNDEGNEYQYLCDGFWY